MNTSQQMEITRRFRGAALAVLLAGAAIGVTGCGHVMMMVHRTGAERPAAGAFGLGPRSSAQALYTATLQPSEPLRPRRMQKVVVALADAQGRPVDAAAIDIDGGMPQHGHGLPTRPRVTKNLGGGRYEIDGVRFNMGGWWEFTLAITATPGADRVTFNLDL